MESDGWFERPVNLFGPCYAETYVMSKTVEKCVKNITPSVDPKLNIVRFKVCIGDLTNSNVLV